MIHTIKNKLSFLGVHLQVKHSFEVFLVRSNPTYENLPRVFIAKIKNQKTQWVHELDEIQEMLFDNEFNEEEAEHLGTINNFDEINLVINLINPEDNSTVDFPVTRKIFWILETLVQDHMKMKMGSVIYVARPKKASKSADIDAAEQAEIKRKREGIDFKSKATRKRSDELYLSEEEVEEYVFKNRKNNRSIYNSKN